jgi:curved DNA-binding protein CbpA
LDAIIETCEIDYDSVALSRGEVFLLSKIDGKATLNTLIRLSGFQLDKALELFDKMGQKGLIKAKKPSSFDDQGASSTDRSNVDLSPDRQARILELYQKLNTMTHYEILGVGRQAEDREIKRSYFSVSKDFHPDTYFRKSLGNFKGKIEAIFKRVSQAYEVLSHEQKRAVYDASLPYEPTFEEIKQNQKKAVQKKRDGDLRAERRRRLLRRNPLAKRKVQARKHHDDAIRHRDRNDPVSAANSIRLALALIPDDPKYLEVLHQVAEKADEIRAEFEVKRGRYEESIGKVDEALEAYLKAIECNPNEVQALHRVADLMLAMKRDLKTALTFCRKAQILDSDSPEIIRTMADLYLEMGMWKNALREYTRYLQQNPLDENVQQVVKDLRRRP